MTRQASIRTLKGHVTRLQRQVDSMGKTLATVTEERDEAASKTEMFRRWWSEGNDERKELREAAAAAELKRDDYRLQFEADREARLRAEADRDRDRAYIEGLLSGMHPQRPRLPWEPAVERIEQVGNVSRVERRY